MSETFQIILGSSIVTTLATAFISYLFHRRTERTNAEIKREFEILSAVQTTSFAWKKQTTELLGQVYIHLNRTSTSFRNNYSKMNRYDAFYENEILYTSNKKIRDLILENGHHIPPHLLDEASKLVEHYDVWLVKYNNVRKVQGDVTTVQLYVGPDGFPFPEHAEDKFKGAYQEMFASITNGVRHHL